MSSKSHPCGHAKNVLHFYMTKLCFADSAFFHIRAMEFGCYPLWNKQSLIKLEILLTTVSDKNEIHAKFQSQETTKWSALVFHIFSKPRKRWTVSLERSRNSDSLNSDCLFGVWSKSRKEVQFSDRLPMLWEIVTGEKDWDKKTEE